MGRFMLDERNPQPFADAVKRFWEMQFGRMCIGCRKLMVLDRGADFQYANTFISDICDGLVSEILKRRRSGI